MTFRKLLYLYDSGRVNLRLPRSQNPLDARGPFGDPFDCLLLREGCVPMASRAFVFLQLWFARVLSRR